MLGHQYHSIALYLKIMLISKYGLGMTCGMRYWRFHHTHILAEGQMVRELHKINHCAVHNACMQHLKDFTLKGGCCVGEFACI